MNDFRQLAYVGWQGNAVSRYFFSPENTARLRAGIASFLGPHVHVGDQVLYGVMSNIAANWNPRTGDIYTRYVIPAAEPRDDLENMNGQVVTVIVNAIRQETEQRELNGRLSVWDSVLGDFNRHGLRAHPILKTKENDYMKGMFSMNY